ncbi:MAG: hypothetical protein G3M70_13235 [Candidatus Nitronauta litoralis]|uniref:Uncharacterized protein n=1 Tax=Candidatus Nitronauta litoralis TaxID=2705533 RepID=A0A7T0BXQ8_9BACT|nr:MAG: hypothetical protein G3M70_13235 [Candidatus Nitronauta litoralis]
MKTTTRKSILSLIVVTAFLLLVSPVEAEIHHENPTDSWYQNDPVNNNPNVQIFENDNIFWGLTHNNPTYTWYEGGTPVDKDMKEIPKNPVAGMDRMDLPEDPTLDWYYNGVSETRSN